MPQKGSPVLTVTWFDGTRGLILSVPPTVIFEIWPVSEVCNTEGRQKMQNSRL